MSTVPSVNPGLKDLMQTLDKDSREVATPSPKENASGPEEADVQSFFDVLA